MKTRYQSNWKCQDTNDVDGKLLGLVMAIFAAGIIIFIFTYICVFDIIYQDYDGNIVVCDVEGVYYSVDRPECQEALKGKWKRDNMTIWQGTCAEDGICTPDPAMPYGDGDSK